MKTIKQDQALMQILKVHEINRIICETNMGVLKLQIRKGENEYRFLLDSVPLPKELHKEVYELLYAPEIPQVWTTRAQPLTAEQIKLMNTNGTILIPKDVSLKDVVVKKKGGRPKGSVNKKNESTKA